MIWVIVFAAIAAAGLLMLVAYAIWLMHKASDVFAELRVLGERTGRIAETLSRIEVPAGLTDPGAPEPVPATPTREAGGTLDEDDPDQNETPHTARRAAQDVG